MSLSWERFCHKFSSLICRLVTKTLACVNILWHWPANNSTMRAKRSGWANPFRVWKLPRSFCWPGWPNSSERPWQGMSLLCNYFYSRKISLPKKLFIVAIYDLDARSHSQRSEGLFLCRLSLVGKIVCGNRDIRQIAWYFFALFQSWYTKSFWIWSSDWCNFSKAIGCHSSVKC